MQKQSCDISNSAIEHAEKPDMAVDSCPEGFWIAASPVDPELADQTFQSIGERARFYEGRPPESLRQRLIQLDQIGDGREVEFVKPFALAYESVIAVAATDSAHLTRRRARLEKIKGVIGTPRDGMGLSFIHHPHEHHLHWGSINIIFDSSIVMPSRHKGYWRAGAESRKRCQELSFQICEIMLDEVERAWNLRPALVRHSRDQERVHWGADYDPSCQDIASDAAARAALNAYQIEQVTRPAQREAPKRSL